MAKKQKVLNLTASTFAATREIADNFKKVLSCEFKSSRWIVGKVREIVFLVTTPEETVEVAVWVVANGDKTYRSLFLVKGEVEMSSTNLFDATKIEYRDEEDARKYGPKNARVCERLNAGEKFAFLCDEYGVFAGDEFDPYYSFIVLEDKTITPFPIILDAAGIDKAPWEHEATEDQIGAFLREHFGDQYTSHLSERSDVIKRQLVKIEDGEVIIVTEFNLWDRPALAQGVPEFTVNLWDYNIDPENQVNPRWLNQQILAGDTPEYLVVEANDEYDIDGLKKTVTEAYQMRAAMIEILGRNPETSEDVNQAHGRSPWALEYMFYLSEGRWFTPPAHRGYYDMDSSMSKLGFTSRHTDDAYKHLWTGDVETFLVFARAIERDSVAGLDYIFWNDRLRREVAVEIRVYQDPKSGQTFSNMKSGRLSRIEKVEGDKALYQAHFS